MPCVHRSLLLSSKTAPKLHEHEWNPGRWNSSGKQWHSDNKGSDPWFNLYRSDFRGSLNREYRLQPSIGSSLRITWGAEQTACLVKPRSTDFACQGFQFIFIHQALNEGKQGLSFMISNWFISAVPVILAPSASNAADLTGQCQVTWASSQFPPYNLSFNYVGYSQRFVSLGCF